MTSIPEQTTIGAVKLKVRDLDGMVSFYTKTIGLNVLYKKGAEAALSADGYHPLLLLKGVANLEERPVRSAGLYHLALLVPERKDLGNVLQHLIETNTVLTGGSNHLFSEAIYLQDPEHNGIEIYRDVDPKDWVRDENGKLLAASERLDVEGLLQVANQSSWDGLPEKTVMGHVHLNVNDLDAAENFYVNLLGFEEQMRMGDHALFVSAGGYHHHIAFNTWNGRGVMATPQGSTGLESYEIVLPSEKDTEKIKSRLQKNNVHFTVQDDTLFVNDPSGNNIVIKHG